jgi:S-DNA-T family DNA segregation ATPase FtsK/SpoIIIE
MGAEHLIGKGGMLFLPPGSSRLINRVVDFWKEQATPEYDQSFLMAPPSDDAEPEGEEAAPGGPDPKNQEGAAIPNAKSLIAI